MSSPCRVFDQNTAHDRRRAPIAHPSRADSRIFLPGRTKTRYPPRLCYCTTAATCTRAPHNRRRPSSDTIADRTLSDLHRRRRLELHIHPHIHIQLRDSRHGYRTGRANWPDTSSSRSTTPIGNQTRCTYRGRRPRASRQKAQAERTLCAKQPIHPAQTQGQACVHDNSPAPFTLPVREPRWQLCLRLAYALCPGAHPDQHSTA